MKPAIFSLAGFLITALVGALAQGGATGAIVGKVQDSSGAMVPSAEIRIENQATGAVVRTLSSDDFCCRRKSQGWVRYFLRSVSASARIP